MRFMPILLTAMLLTACELVDSPSKAVDAATLPPMSARERSLIFAADGAVQQSNYAAAERDYLTAIADSKGHVDAHMGLARMYDKQGQRDKEEVILKRALELQPDHGLANYMLGKLYLDTYRFSEAASTFERGLKTRPDDIDLNVGEAVANDMQGRHSAAQMSYLRVMKTNPSANLSNVRTNLAMSYLLSDQPKKAIELLKPEAKKPNASPVTRHNLALAYGVLGRHPDARKVLNGEMDEENRLLAIARLNEYLKEREKLKSDAPPLTPVIKDAPAAPASTPVKSAVPTTPPAEVKDAKEAKPVAKDVKPAAKKAEPKPEAKKVETKKSAEKKPEVKPEVKSEVKTETKAPVEKVESKPVDLKPAAQAIKPETKLE